MFVEDKSLKDTILFCVSGEWAIKISPEGIAFNRGAFPHWQPDDFAEQFMELLEGSYNVEFAKVKDAAQEG